MELDIRKAVFIVPFGYEVNEELTEPDYCLHGGPAEAALLNSDGVFVVRDLPVDKFHTTQDRSAVAGKIMHYQTIMSPDGKRYFPLFDSYNAATRIYGENIRFTMVCYETARKMAISENLEGIVLCPGTVNQIIPKEAFA